MKFNITITGAHILVLLLIIVLALACRRMINLLSRHIAIESDEMLRDTKYDEKEILAHLDYIITEAIDTYELFHIRPQNIFYINSKIENEILATVSEQVSHRISKTLMVQLAFIYSDSYIGEFIGSHIHLMVTEYVINFNTNSPLEENTPTASTAQQES